MRESDGPGALPEELASNRTLTVESIARREKQPWRWVIRMIAPFKDRLVLPADITKLRQIAVPAEIANRIHNITYTITQAGDWLTTTAMADRLGVEYKWVNRRILYLQSPCEFRLYSDSRSLLHFPPEALDELQAIRDKAVEHIDRKSFVNKAELAAATGRHRLWVSNRLDIIGAESKFGYGESGKLVEYYPIEVLGLLLEEKGKYEDSGDRLSIPMLAKAVGRDRQWVERLLEEIEAEGELSRFRRSGRVDIGFSPEVLRNILARAEGYKKPDLGWLTENALIGQTGKSFNWVRSRLNKLDVVAELRQDSHGVLRKHYPPEVLDRLKEMKEGWKIPGSIKEAGKVKSDQADKFRTTFNLTGTTVSRNGLSQLGVSETDIKYWRSLGLVTRWSNGMYYFTKKAKLLVQRMNIADQQVESLRRMKEWLGR